MLYDPLAALRGRVLNAKQSIANCNSILQSLSIASMILSNGKGKIRIFVEDEVHKVELPLMDVYTAVTKYHLDRYIGLQVRSVGHVRWAAVRDRDQATAVMAKMNVTIDNEMEEH